MIRLIAFALLALMVLAPAAAQTSEAVLTLQHDGGVVTASWNADESKILSATERGLVQVWSADEGAPLQEIDHGGNPVTHALWMQGRRGNSVRR